MSRRLLLDTSVLLSGIVGRPTSLESPDGRLVLDAARTKTHGRITYAGASPSR